MRTGIILLSGWRSVIMTHVWRQRVVLQPLWAYQYAAPIPKIAW